MSDDTPPGRMDDPTARILRVLSALPPAGGLALSAALAVVTVGIDAASVDGRSHGLGYAFTVAVAAWTVSTVAAYGLGFILTGAAGAILLSSADFGVHDRSWWLEIANRSITLFFTAAIVAALRTHVARADHDADHDPLTGLHSRRAVITHLHRAVARTRRHGGTLSVVYFDLDELKEVNDRLGHVAGDRTIVDFARCLQRGVRHGDIVGRLGGDEFLLVCPDTTAAAADAVVERLLRQPGVPTVSWGVASTTDSWDPESLVATADRSMYEVKRNARPGRHAHDA